jgi:hypothetical protein
MVILLPDESTDLAVVSPGRWESMETQWACTSRSISQLTCAQFPAKCYFQLDGYPVYLLVNARMMHFFQVFNWE